MVKPYSEIDAEYQDFDSDGAGISKDTFIDENNPTTNYGLNQFLIVEFDDNTFPTPNKELRTVLEVTMPNDEDIVGFDDVIDIWIELYAYSITYVDDPWKVVSLVEIEDDWDEYDGGNGADWEEAKDGVAWDRGDGALNSSTGNIEEPQIDVERIQSGGINMWYKWKITRAISMGEKKTFVLFISTDGNFGDDSFEVRFRSREYTSDTTKLPLLRVRYRSYPPEGFKDDNAKLRIDPYENNPEQPILTWGAVEAPDFQQYKLYRSTTPIGSLDTYKSAITGVNQSTDEFTISGDETLSFPVGSTFRVVNSTGNDGRYEVASSSFGGGSTTIGIVGDIPDSTVDGSILHGLITSVDSALAEYVDVDTLSDGSTYYYKLTAEDLDNHEDQSLLSSPVSFTKPTITSSTLSPSGAQNVGTQVSLTVVAPQPIKRVFVDWKDGSESWYEFEVAATTQVVNHIYTDWSNSVAWRPDVRVEDELGFWSSLKAAANTITVNDTTPLAKIISGARLEIQGSRIYVNGIMSQPKGSNVTISKYEFRNEFPIENAVNGSPNDWFIIHGDVTAVFGSGTLTVIDSPGNDGTYTIVSAVYQSGPDYTVVYVSTPISVFLPGGYAHKGYVDNGADPFYDFLTTGYGVGTFLTRHRFRLRVTTTSALTAEDFISYELYKLAPLELEFSADTRIQEVPHSLGLDKQDAVPIGSEGSEIRTRLARREERIIVTGTSHFPHMETDMDLIRNAWINDSYIRIRIKTERDESGDTLYDGYIDGEPQYTQSYDNMLQWSFPMVVKVRTKV